MAAEAGTSARVVRTFLSETLRSESSTIDDDGDNNDPEEEETGLPNCNIGMALLLFLSIPFGRASANADDDPGGLEATDDRPPPPPPPPPRSPPFVIGWFYINGLVGFSSPPPGGRCPVQRPAPAPPVALPVAP